MRSPKEKDKEKPQMALIGPSEAFFWDGLSETGSSGKASAGKGNVGA